MSTALKVSLALLIPLAGAGCLSRAAHDQGRAPALPTTSAATSDTVRVAVPTGEKETDRASIIAALEGVHPGGTVQFAPGTYLIGGLNLDVAVPRITLLGHSDGTTLQGCEPDAFEDFQAAMFACNGLGLSGGHQTVRDLTFEHAWHGITIGCCLPASVEEFETGEGPERMQPGGYLIEGNTFRFTPNGMRVLGKSDQTTVIPPLRNPAPTLVRVPPPMGEGESDRASILVALEQVQRGAREMTQPL